jgi:hypothetical protein
MKVSHPWTAFALSIALCGIVLVATLVRPSSGLNVSFLAFLPMCFYMVGASLVELQREVAALRERVAELEAERGPPFDAAETKVDTVSGRST